MLGYRSDVSDELHIHPSEDFAQPGSCYVPLAFNHSSHDFLMTEACRPTYFISRYVLNSQQTFEYTLGYACVCTRTWVCVCACEYLCTRVRICVRVCARTHTCAIVSSCSFPCACAIERASACEFKCMSASVYACMRIRIRERGSMA